MDTKGGEEDGDKERGNGHDSKDRPRRPTLSAAERARRSMPQHLSGDAYRSRKGQGDAKRRGQKLEPYAYVAMDPRQLSAHGSSMAVARYAPFVGPKAKQAAKRRKK
jgi:hypothetical protein